MAVGEFTPYSGVAGYRQSHPAWVPADQAERISAYQIYEEIYWTHSETFKLMLRGDEGKPLYVPTARTVVETANRYIGKGMSIIADPLLGTPNDRTNLQVAFDALFARERFYSKYAMNKRYGLIRGDWLFHVMGNDQKEEGKRLSIQAVDPGSYFTVPHPEDENRIWKVHLAEVIVDEDGNELVRRQTYEKTDEGRIITSLSDFKIDQWASGDSAAEAVITPPTELDPRIAAIPVYHVRNKEEPENPFGSSEIRGFERLLAGLNQGITDEDVALAMEGLGLYSTDGAGPVDEEGNETDWIIGPGRVVENAPGFKRVNGVGSVQPYQDHLNWIKEQMFEASGTGDALNIDVQVAESGVALGLRLAPILSRAEEADLIIIEVMNQMMYDLATMWLPVYERQSFGDALPIASMGEKLPKNRDNEVKLVAELLSTDPPIMSAQTARKYLTQFGYQFETNEAEIVAQEKALMTEATTPVDSFEERAAEEEGTSGGSSNAGANGEGEVTGALTR